MPRNKKTGEPAAQSNAAAVSTAASSAFRPGPDWLSITETAGALGYPEKTGANRVRAAAKVSPLLQGDGNVTAITFEGYAIPPVLYFHRDAVTRYAAEIAKAPTRGGRGRTAGYKSFSVKIPIADVDRIRGLLGDIGVTLIEPKSRSKKTAAAQPIAADAASDVGVNESETNEPATA